MEQERKRRRTDDDGDTEQEVYFTYHEKWGQLQCCCGCMIEGSHECKSSMKKVGIRECSRSKCLICKLKDDQCKVWTDVYKNVSNYSSQF